MDIFRNKKNGKNYIVLYHDVVNATNNAGDNEIMVVYISCDKGFLFVREQIEFMDKFERINPLRDFYSIDNKKVKECNGCRYAPHTPESCDSCDENRSNFMSEIYVDINTTQEKDESMFFVNDRQTEEEFVPFPQKKLITENNGKSKFVSEEKGKIIPKHVQLDGSRTVLEYNEKTDTYYCLGAGFHIHYIINTNGEVIVHDKSHPLIDGVKLIPILENIYEEFKNKK